jgi:hypothetical protein
MASEDSDQLLPRLAVVHRLCDLRDLDQAGHREMPARVADLNAACEALEVGPLRGAKRVLPEERDHDLEQLIAGANDEPVQMLLVVVVPSIDRDGADSKEVPQLVKRAHAPRSLDNHEAVGHLITGSITASPSPIGLLDEADGEATFPIHETDYPADSDQPFLLVFRTARIVTVHASEARTSTGRILGFSSI